MMTRRRIRKVTSRMTLAMTPAVAQTSTMRATAMIGMSWSARQRNVSYLPLTSREMKG
jgi:hypothetical protein